MKSTRRPSTVMYTNHFAAILISRQTSLTTFSIDKLNLRLVCAFQYLSMFDLFVRYKAKRTNIVPDALSRLQGSSIIIAKDNSRILKALHGQVEEERFIDFMRSEMSISYYITLVEMLEDFKSRLTKVYVKNKQWNRILKVLKRAEKKALSDQTQERPLQGSVTEAGVSPVDTADATGVPPSNTADAPEIQTVGLRFKLREGLIYYTNFDDGRKRLCIFNSLEKEIFELAHDRQHYEGYHRTYDRISNSMYLKHLFKHLRIYIEHCPECELN